MRGLCVALLLFVSACGPTSDPPDADASPVDTGPVDSGVEDTSIADTLLDASVCVAVDEMCNGVDDDCDGAVDEAFDLPTDVNNCGACADACPGAPQQVPACVMGTCTAECLPGYADCNGMDADGCEADLNVPESCGDCDSMCAAGEVCAGGTCEVACPGGTSLCGGSCADTESDLSHCGACDSRCPSVASGAPSCVAGVCVVGSCSTSWADCNGDIADGCETNLRGSTEHCGACGTACGPTEACNAGACVPGSSSCGALEDWTFGTGGVICRGMCLDLTIQCTSGACGCSRSGMTLTCGDDTTCMDVVSSGCCFSLLST